MLLLGVGDDVRLREGTVALLVRRELGHRLGDAVLHLVAHARESICRSRTELLRLDLLLEQAHLLDDRDEAADCVASSMSEAICMNSGSSA